MVPTDVREDKVVTALLTKVPDVGKVTLVEAVEVNVTGNAPDVVKLPPNVIVLAPLFTPVPPYVPPITLPFQVPDAIVPVDVILPCTALGNVDEIDGAPPPLVINTPLFAVAKPETTVPVAA